jgi:ATP-dependent DNA helicase RecQ
VIGWISRQPRPLPGPLDVPALEACRAAHPEALAHPRQAARFLTGLTSPALTKAKLSRHPLFAALEGYPFAEVLAWLNG